MPGKRPLMDRFIDKVSPEPNTGCWLWTAFATHEGYGRLTEGKMRSSRSKVASRIAFELFVGPVPAGFQVCHRCDHPPCVNPAHLFLGTNRDNMADKVRKGRQARGERHMSVTHPGIFAGERNPRARLTWAEVGEIRRLHGPGMSYTRLAARFGVTKGTVAAIITGATWKQA